MTSKIAGWLVVYFNPLHATPAERGSDGGNHRWTADPVYLKYFLRGLAELPFSVAIDQVTLDVAKVDHFLMAELTGKLDRAYKPNGQLVGPLWTEDQMRDAYREAVGTIDLYAPGQFSMSQDDAGNGFAQSQVLLVCGWDATYREYDPQQGVYLEGIAAKTIPQPVVDGVGRRLLPIQGFDPGGAFREWQKTGNLRPVNTAAGYACGYFCPEMASTPGEALDYLRAVAASPAHGMVPWREFISHIVFDDQVFTKGAVFADRDLRVKILHTAARQQRHRRIQQLLQRPELETRLARNAALRNLLMCSDGIIGVDGSAAPGNVDVDIGTMQGNLLMQLKRDPIGPVSNLDQGVVHPSNQRLAKRYEELINEMG